MINLARAEAGALHYKIGSITLDTNIGGAKGLTSKLMSAALTDESVVKPLYKGTGDIYLEPSYGYYVIVMLNNEGNFRHPILGFVVNFCNFVDLIFRGCCR